MEGFGGFEDEVIDREVVKEEEKEVEEEEGEEEREGGERQSDTRRAFIEQKQLTITINMVLLGPQSVEGRTEENETELRSLLIYLERRR